MKNKIKDTIRDEVKKVFLIVEKNRFFKWILSLNFFVRVIIFIFLGLWSLLALLTPIPAGWVTMIFAFAIMFGIKPVRRISIRLIYFLRIPLLWKKYKEWKQRRS